MMSPYLTESEAIQYLRIERMKRPIEIVQRLCRKGKIKAVKRGRDYLFKTEWLEAYLHESMA